MLSVSLRYFYSQLSGEDWSMEGEGGGGGGEKDHQQ